MGLCGFSLPNFHVMICDDCENVYFIVLSSSNPKYEPLAIV